MAQEFCCNKSRGYRLINQLGLHESTWGDLKGALGLDLGVGTFVQLLVDNYKE